MFSKGTLLKKPLALQVGRAHPVRAILGLLLCAGLTAAHLQSSQDEASSEPAQGHSSTKISLVVVVSID